MTPVSESENIVERLIFDRFFLEYIFSLDKEVRNDIINKLRMIHTKSPYAPFMHNVCPDLCFKSIGKIKDDGADYSEKRCGIILGFCHPEKEKEGDLHREIIHKAIDLSSKRPYRTMILTNAGNSSIYLNHKDYSQYPGVKESISVVSEKEALQKIGEVYLRLMKINSQNN